MKAPSMASVTLDVESESTVAEVKKKVEEKFHVAPSRQKLIFSGIDLQDEKTLSECAVTDKSVLNVYFEPPPKVTKVVTFPAGQCNAGSTHTSRSSTPHYTPLFFAST